MCDSRCVATLQYETTKNITTTINENDELTPDIKINSQIYENPFNKDNCPCKEIPSFDDIVLSENCYSESNYALTLNNENCHLTSSDSTLNSVIEKVSQDINVPIYKGNTVCTDCFDVYMTDVNKFLSRIPEGLNPVSAEMEAFALFYNAQLLNKKAACLMSVVDSKFIEKIASPEERQNGLNAMIKLALESAIQI